MAKFKSLLLGHLVKPAGMKRKCYHSKTCIITKGDAVLEVSNGQMATQGYCIKCAKQMIALAAEELDRIRNQLDELA